MNIIPKWQRKVLSNGLKVLLYPRPSSMTTQLSAAINYGANSDPEENAGRAHFLEHMLAGGSFKRIDLSRQPEYMGGYIDFCTNPEYTFTTVSVLPNKISEASQIMSELLFDSSFEEEKFEIERQIILNEISEAHDNPIERINQLLRNCLFKKHPIKRDNTGTRKSVGELSRRKLIEAHNSYYTMANMILIFTGRFSEEKVDLILDDFDSKGKKEKAPIKQRFFEKDGIRRKITITKPGVSQTYLSIGARTVPSRHSDAPVMDLISTLLGSGTSSRLFIEVREKQGLAYDIPASHECGSDYGFFNIDCAVKPRNLTRTVDIVQKEIQKIRTESVEETELKKGKNIIVGEILREVDNPNFLPATLAECEILFNTENAIVEYLERINAISSDDIMMVANKYLVSDMLSTAILCPSQKS